MVKITIDENHAGTRIQEEAVRVWGIDSGRPDEHLGRPEMAVEYRPGTREVAEAEVWFSGADASDLRIKVTPLRTVYLKGGSGYFYDGYWGHGIDHGGSVIEGVTHDIALARRARRVVLAQRDAEPLRGERRHASATACTRTCASACTRPPASTTRRAWLHDRYRQTIRISSAPKFHKDRSGYGDALRGWFDADQPGVGPTSRSRSLQIPIATGFSNETVVFSAGWSEGGERHQERLVARIEPPDGGLFPVQTPAVTVSVGLQYRIMETVGRLGAAPVPPLVGYEADPNGAGTAVLRHAVRADGWSPVTHRDTPQSGFLVDEATPAQRRDMVHNGLEAMAGLHGIDWREADLGWLDASGTGNPTNEHQLEVYRRYVRSELRGREHPVMMEALDWLARPRPR